MSSRALQWNEWQRVAFAVMEDETEGCFPHSVTGLREMIEVFFNQMSEEQGERALLKLIRHIHEEEIQS